MSSSTRSVTISASPTTTSTPSRRRPDSRDSATSGYTFPGSRQLTESLIERISGREDNQARSGDRDAPFQHRHPLWHHFPVVSFRDGCARHRRFPPRPARPRPPRLLAGPPRPPRLAPTLPPAPLPPRPAPPPPP